MTKNLLSTLLLIACGLSGVCSLVGADAPKDGLVVQIQIFSGRPNPTFTVVEPNLVAEILNEVVGIPKVSDATGTEEVLGKTMGFTGFIVQNLSSLHSDIQSFEIDRSDVAIVHGKSSPNLPEVRTVHRAADNRLVLILLDMALAAKVIDRETWAAARASRMPGVNGTVDSK
jgi:hypothetical protein